LQEGGVFPGELLLEAWALFGSKAADARARNGNHGKDRQPQARSQHVVNPAG